MNQILLPLSQLVTAAGQPIHAVYYPFPLATTLHAIRISCAYRGRVRASGKEQAMRQKGRAVEIAGFLVMAWGGSFLTSFLMGVTPPQLLSIWPFLNYVSVHLILSSILSTASIPPAHLFDTVFVLFDALTRTFPITGAVASLASLPVASPQRNSLLFQLLVGALACSGGGITASTLNVFDPTWSFSTPPILFAGWPAYFDFVAGLVGAYIYGLLTSSHPSHARTSQALHVYLGGSSKLLAQGVMTPLGAKAVVCAVLTVLYAGRALAMHGNRAFIVGTSGTVSSKKQGKKLQ